MEILYYTLLGAVVVWGVIYRYRTLHKLEYFLGMRVTLFAFASLAIGLAITHPEVARNVVEEATDGDRILFFPLVIYGCWFLYLYAIKTILHFQMGALLLVGVGGTFLLSLALKMEPFGHFYPASTAAFIALFLVLGGIHAVLGPVIAAVNLALAINYFAHTFHFDYQALFNVLDLVGIESGPFRIVAIVLSTAFGLMEAVHFFGLKEVIRSLFDPHW